MKHLTLVSALLCLMACSAQPGEDAAETPAPAATVPVAPAGAASPAADAAAPGPAAAPVAPSFDCARAAGGIEQLVCADPELARLDRQLAGRYAELKDRPESRQAVALQRGWVKDRDECWKADDKPRCVREAYLTRLVELAINGGGVVVPTPVEYRCDDDSRPLTAVFYNDIDPQAAVITWGNDQAIAFPQPVASGIHYSREGLDFREHQGEVEVDFYGNHLACRPAT